MFDLIETLQNHGIEVKQHSTKEDEYRICCLFCVDRGESPDEKFRLGFNIRTGVGGCFNCGWKSRKALLAIMRRLGEAGFDSTRVQFIPPAHVENEKVSLPEGFQLLSELDDDDILFGPAIGYAKKRGITKRQFLEKEIGATVQDSKYKYRLIFPVRDGKSKLVGYVGRDWTGTHPAKYMNNMGAARHIYNARPDKYSHKIIVLSEGLTKSLAIERATDYEVCSGATLGNSITDVQIEQLRAFDETILFPDPDRAGMHGYLAVAANLASILKKVSLAWPWPKKQADDMSSKEIMDVLSARVKYSMTLEWRLRIEAAGR
jgi:hypothetical protein